MRGVVSTIGERCRRCYTCVRSCPAKAIKVQDGQAKVLSERCIGCGNCIRVCAQGAKRVESEALPRTKEMIAEGDEVVAILAPSFPVAVKGVKPLQLVEAVRRLGFSTVMEVALGAELSARAYRRLLEKGDGSEHMISTPCPALVSYVEKYLPHLVPNLAPVVSPMVALGRLIKERLKPKAKVVFIGPCVAKKAEARDPSVEGAIDSVLTYQELREWLEERGIDVGALPESDFDGPHAGVGRIFPVSGGLLRTAAIEADVLESRIVVTEGVDRITHLLREFDKDGLSAQFFDLLFCEGCINGPFASDSENTMILKQRVADYTREQLSRHQTCSLEQYDDLDMSRGFSDLHVEAPDPSEEEIRTILRETGKMKPEDELNCGACGYPTCREKAIAVYHGLAEAEMCLPYLIEELQRTIGELNDSRRNLIETEQQLVQSEKLASMGQLAAGVAHELNNPLGTVLIYAHMLLKALTPDDPRREDIQMITREADRCRHIVRGLLDFSRQSRLRDEPTDVNRLLAETLEPLAKQEDFAGTALETAFEEGLPKTLLDREQMRQAFINVVENAVEAMTTGGTLEVATRLTPDGKGIAIQFSDTGRGIPEESLERIFDPFFTTKQIGKGTGLGLAIVYGIVKMHRGAVAVDSKVGAGTTFTITVPVLESREERGAV